MPCIFCEIIAGRMPAHRIYEDEQCLAFMDIMPITSGHVLVIPKEHAANIWELSPPASAALMPAAQRVALALRKSGLPCEGINLFMANNAVAGQSVFHAHLHVVPRVHGDGFGLRFPPQYGQSVQSEILQQQAERIKEAL